MKKVVVRNPEELQVITNPHKKTSTMGKITTEKALEEFQEQAKTAGYILGGQAIGAQLNALVIPSVLGTQNATVQQVARAGIPITLGVLATLGVKNKHVRGLSLGLGVQGVLELIKLVMPDFSPSQGFSDGSEFVFTDQNGNQKRAVVTPEGEVILPDGRTMMLPAANGKKEESKMVNGSGNGLEDFADSEYAEHEGVDYL